jgi:hypothetical protein
MPEYPLDKPDLEGNTGTVISIAFSVVTFMSSDYFILIHVQLCVLAY